jgi:hypothetical protein
MVGWFVPLFLQGCFRFMIIWKFTPSLSNLLRASNSSEHCFPWDAWKWTFLYMGTGTNLFLKHIRISVPNGPLADDIRVTSLCSSRKSKERRQDGSGMNYSVASLSSWSKSPCNPITEITSSLCIFGCVPKERTFYDFLWTFDTLEASWMYYLHVTLIL